MIGSKSELVELLEQNSLKGPGFGNPGELYQSSLKFAKVRSISQLF